MFSAQDNNIFTKLRLNLQGNTLPSDLFKAITAGLGQGLTNEQQKKADLAYTLVSIVSLAESNKVMKSRMLRHIKPVMRNGWTTLYNFFAGAKVQNTIKQYVIDKDDKDEN